MNNGGLDQYFFNPTGDFAHETVKSLIVVGAYRTAQILQAAISQFPDGKVPTNRHQRVETMKQIETAASVIWENLNHEFYTYSDDLNFLNLAFVRKNMEEFNLDV